MRHFELLVVLFATACTGIVDSDDSVPPPPPPATDVQVVVRDGSVPQANVRAIFQSADDTVVAEVLTDAAGLAVAEMPAGGNLTVIRTYPPAVPPEEPRLPEVFTYVGVKPGDRLQLGNAVATEGPASAINVIVPKDAVGTIKVLAPCGAGQGTAPTVAITVRGCSSEVAFYVTDQDQSSFWKRAAYSENVDLGNEILSGKLTSTLAATNVALDTTVSVEKRIEVDGFRLYSSGAKRVDATPAAVDLPDLQGVEQLVITAIAQPENRAQVVADRTAYSIGPSIVDASAGLISSVSDLKFEPTGVTWVEAGSGTADLVVATLRITPAPPMGQEPDPNAVYVRAVIAPHTGTSLRLPRLPGGYNPVMGDQIAGAHGIVKVTGGYDAIRPRAFTVTSIVDAVTMDGQATLSYVGPAPTL